MMTRLIAGFATAAVLLTAAPAQAAPPAPLKALKKQTSVRFTERTHIVAGSSKVVFTRRSGAFLLNSSGIKASDVTAKLAIKAADLTDAALMWMLDPERTIRIGTTSYISGGYFATRLPVDRTWLKVAKGPAAGVTGIYGQLVNVAEARTLAALLKTATRTSYGYRGTITLGRLHQSSPWLRASIGNLLGKPKTVISWRLTLDARGLPIRLVSQYSSGADGDVVMDTRFSGWSGKLKIVAPPADQVWEGGAAELPQSPPVTSPMSGGQVVP
ncbi:hypothetical protein ACIBH1_01880 [Nonomuraea sp. NPDC050663]|uniref:hypothetical protein n=1 Tax=Nonomuraea sp. NPDC050663 TaxID=3364370 RepID=UPI003788DA13